MMIIEGLIEKHKTIFCFLKSWDEFVIFLNTSIKLNKKWTNGNAIDIEKFTKRSDFFIPCYLAMSENTIGNVASSILFYAEPEAIIDISLFNII